MTTTGLKKYIRRYTSIPSALNLLQRKELVLLDPQNWDDRNDRHFMKLYKEAKGYASLYGLCATQCSETYHHWRVFTGTADGVCLEIEREPLEARLGGKPNVRFGAMEYLKLDEVGKLAAADVDRLPFLKRYGFRHEEEYRIVAHSAEEQSSALIVDFDLAWIGRITINPWLPDSLAETIQGVIRGLPDCAKIRLAKSRLIENTRWKRAGDRVVGRSGAARRLTP